jgi:hypothetical protein
VEFIEPNLLYRTGLSVSQDDGSANKLGLSFIEFGEDGARYAAIEVLRQCRRPDGRGLFWIAVEGPAQRRGRSRSSASFLFRRSRDTPIAARLMALVFAC